MTSKKQVRLSEEIIPKLHEAFKTDKKHIIITSGRAGTKSSFGAVKADFMCVQSSCSVIVLRKRHNKVRKTVYKEILRGFKRLCIPKRNIEDKLSPMQIKYLPKKSTIYFSGSDGIDDTKGIIDEDNPIKLVLIDEVTEFFEGTTADGEEELSNIEATFVRGNKEGFQMMYLYNPPKNPYAPINQWRDKMVSRDDCIHIHVDYRDVPEDWLGEDLIKSALMMKATDEKLYNWIWLGKSIGIDEVIYYMFSEKNEAEPVKEYAEIGIGVDYGQQNATTYQPFGVNYKKKRLEGLPEYFHSGRDTGKQKSPSEYGKEFAIHAKMLIEKYNAKVLYVFIDPSAAGLREEIKRACEIEGVYPSFRQAENSVNTGIFRVQIALSYGIMTLCDEQPQLKRQMRGYEWDKKALERGKEMPVKFDDDACDAQRYCLMGMWHIVKQFLPFDVDLIEKERSE